MLLRGFRAVLILIIVLVITSTTAYAEGIDINLGEEAVQLKYTTAIGGNNYGRSELLFGVLYNETTEAAVAELGMMVIDIAGSKAPGLEIGVGPKIIVVDTKHGDATALSLGGRLRYKSGQQSRLFLRARLFYAPGVVSFADAQNLTEAVFELGFELLPTADIYVGYRNIEADFDGTRKDDIDESGYFGMKIVF